MDTKWRNCSHLAITKISVFVIAIACFTGAIFTFTNILTHGYDPGIIFEDNYYVGEEYIRERHDITQCLIRLIKDYKSEENILNGGTITEDEVDRKADKLFSQFRYDSKYYNPNLSEEENYIKFQEVYSDKLSQIKNDLIKEHLQDYKYRLRQLNDYKGINYYVSDGEFEFSNSATNNKEFFEAFPSYVIFDASKEEVYPREIEYDNRYYFDASNFNELDRQNNVMYVGFSDEFLSSRVNKWEENKIIVTNNLYRIAGFLLGLILSFIYLVLVTGRKSFEDKEVHFNSLDRLYNDINLGLCLGLIMLWFLLLQAVDIHDAHKIIILVTAPIATLGLMLVLSLVKHIKNRTFIKHTLIYRIFIFATDVYDSGSVGMKIVLVVIGYPLLVAVTFPIFPVTIGLVTWLTFKRVKEFNEIKEGVEKIKNGDIHHLINLPKRGEFGKLAANINSIGDGLNKAVANELKSERLKNELITNVSHDIRTPLTSIIAYVDLLKKEGEQSKAGEYIEIINHKAQRLKKLTDDLFEASKASSGNIPVKYERIDIVSLITQGLGELDDKTKELELEFKITHPRDKVYITADGNLLWRAIENLLSNIFKYALKGSRVYINIEYLGNEVMLIIKNISAFELNISADELMERFKRGDESRSSQGSGLGLSIAKSLIDIQNGSFNVEIDGDLFKVIIQMPKCTTDI